MRLSTAVSVAICVPVRDEEELLPALLASLSAQDAAGCEATACFFLDGCADRSEAVLRRAAADFPFPIAVICGRRRRSDNAGRARAAAMAMGLEHVQSRAGGILLTTDADSRPRPDWITASLRALAKADVAAGRIVRINGASDIVQTRLETYYDRLHAYRRAIDPVPWDSPCGRHFSGGANLAFRASVYQAVGGFKPMRSAEDATLLDDAARAGFRVRRDPAMIVETSSRRHGRARGGLADALCAMETAGLPQVTHPADAAWQYRAHAQARTTFAMLTEARVRDRFAALIGLSGDHVAGVGRDCPNAEAFAMRIVPAAPGRRLVPLADAEEALAELERSRCGRAA